MSSSPRARPPCDDLGAIAASLEAVCARLARLRLPATRAALGPEAAGLLDAVLADPELHRPLLERLAGLAASGSAVLCAALTALARELNDRLSDPDDGYPPIEADPPGLPSSDPSSGSDPSSSDTDDADRLTDEDAEDLLRGHWDWGHAERKELRNKFRAEGIPDWYASRMSELAQDGRGPWWSGEEDSESRALSREASQERAEEESTLQSRLEEAEETLADLGIALDAEEPGLADGVAQEDPLDILLGLVAEPSGGGKRPRLEGAAAKHAAAEAKIEERDAADERRNAAREQLEAALGTYCALTGADPGAYDTLSAEPRALPGRLAWKAGAFLDRFWDEAAEVDLAAVQGCVAELRAHLDTLTEERPDLKRRRADAEAIDEIRAEQRGTDETLDPAAFARLVAEIGGDYREDFRIDAGGLEALQVAAEGYLLELLEAGGLAAIHAGRTYLAPEDLHLARRLRGER